MAKISGGSIEGVNNETARTGSVAGCLAGASSWSIAAWVKVTTENADTGAEVFGGFSSFPYDFALNITNKRYLLRVRNAADGAASFTNSSESDTFAINEWIHFAFTYDENTENVLAYINGVNNAARTHASAGLVLSSTNPSFHYVGTVSTTNTIRTCHKAEWSGGVLSQDDIDALVSGDVPTSALVNNNAFHYVPLNRATAEAVNTAHAELDDLGDFGLNFDTSLNGTPEWVTDGPGPFVTVARAYSLDAFYTAALMRPRQ